MVELPKVERNEVRKILAKWKYKGKDLEHMTDKICANPEAWLQFMMAFELSLSPVEKSAPFRSFLTVISATVVGSIIPLVVSHSRRT